MEKRVLAVTHMMNYTGAPTVLRRMLAVLREMDYEVYLVSMQEGEQRKEFESIGVQIQVYPFFWNNREYMDFIGNTFDFIIVNTMALSDLVVALNGRTIPVVWWLHEPRLFMKPMEIELKDNIYLYAAGAVVEEGIKEQLGYEASILNFGLEYMSSGTVEPEETNGVVRFLLAGQYSYVKGQDILVEAISELSEEIRSKCRFIFIGNYGADKYVNCVEEASRKYNEVYMIPGVDREKMPDIYKMADCVIAPSRVDATPAVIVEGMMFGKIALCSTGTGISRYIKDGENGFIFEKENVKALTDKITYIVNNFDKLNEVGRRGRQVYEKYFSMEVFRENVVRVLDDIGLKNK